MISVKLLLVLATIVWVECNVLVRIVAGNSTVGIYYPAQLDEKHPVFNETVVETFLTVLNPGEAAVENVNFNTGLTIRSGNLITRTRLNFGTTLNHTDYPYSISFLNIHEDDRGGGKPIELQHGGSEYVWIDAGNSITHMTGPIHEFHVRDHLKSNFFTVSLWDANEEL